MKKEYIEIAMRDRIEKLRVASEQARRQNKNITADKLDFAAEEIQALLDFAQS